MYNSVQLKFYSGSYRWSILCADIWLGVVWKLKLSPPSMWMQLQRQTEAQSSLCLLDVDGLAINEAS